VVSPVAGAAKSLTFLPGIVELLSTG